ncbi:MAG: sigma-70 family RNA polymerase sigma factor [Roseovarius sp.]
MTELQEIENLIARVAMGDREAFRRIYSRTSAKLFGVVLRVLNDRAEAEDVLQDVYVKIWNNAGRYRANGLSPMTWLITIARNAAIDRKRRQRAATVGDVLTETLADPSPGPEGQAIAASDSARLEGCFGELDGAHAEAVRRAYLEGESYAELAAHFDVPLNTMRTWLRRSLLKLRECLSR